MYLYEATTSNYQQDKWRFWSTKPNLLHNYTIVTGEGTTHHGRGYDNWLSCKAAGMRELKKFDSIGVPASCWWTMDVERVEYGS